MTRIKFYICATPDEAEVKAASLRRDGYKTEVTRGKGRSATPLTVWAWVERLLVTSRRSRKPPIIAGPTDDDLQQLENEEL